MQLFVASPFYQIRCSIVVSISACHAEDPGSIPGGGVLFSLPWDVKLALCAPFFFAGSLDALEHNASARGEPVARRTLN